MDRETYESQKAFAGEKIPSMHRRMVGHDYQERRMYMITMVTEERRPLLGTVAGKSDGLSGTPDEPRTVPTELGSRVAQCWHEIAVRYPQIDVLAFQLMPDHFHGILFVKERLDRPLGKVLLGFKQGCNKAFRALLPSVASVAVLQQQTIQQQTGHYDRKHGLLFEPNYNDKVLLQAGQLKRWNDYLCDNPRRLLLKRAKPEFLRPFFNLRLGSFVYNGVGNRALLSAPQRQPVRVSRRCTEQDIKAEVARFMALACQGTVLVSPAISPGEKRVMRAAFDAGLPTVVIMQNGFTPLSKPKGEQFYACSEGRLLMLSAWDHHNEKQPLTAHQCQRMNLMALELCQLQPSQTAPA